MEMHYGGYRTHVAGAGNEAHGYTPIGPLLLRSVLSLREAARHLKCESGLIDGDAIVLDRNGK